MKSVFIAICLTTLAPPGLAVAQTVQTDAARRVIAEKKATVLLANLAANQTWGWYHSVNWIESKILGRPGWQRYGTKDDTDGWRWAIYCDLDSTAAIQVSFFRENIAGYIYTFLPSNSLANKWITEKFERVSENEWQDKKNNAQIYRYYNGQKIEYKVRYYDFNE